MRVASQIRGFFTRAVDATRSVRLFIVVVAALLCVAIGSWVYLERRAGGLDAGVRVGTQQLLLLSDMRGALRQAQSSRRDFAQTGVSGLLIPFESASRRLLAVFGGRRGGWRNFPLAATERRSIERSTREYLDSLRNSIERRRVNPEDVDSQLAATSEGDILFQELLIRFEGAERRVIEGIGAASRKISSLRRVERVIEPATFVLLALLVALTVSHMRTQVRTLAAANVSLAEARAESARAEERSRRLLAANREGVAILDAAGRVVAHNARFLALLGLVGADLLYQPLREALLGSEAFASLSEVLASRPGLGTSVLEIHVTGSGTKSTWVECVFDCSTDRSESILTVHEISNLKRSELAVREVARDLRAKFEDLPLAVVCVDLEGRITSVNHAAERLFRLRADDVVGSAWSGLNLVSFLSPPAFRLLSAGEQRAQQGGLISEHGVELARMNGERFLANLTMGGLRDDAGSMVAVAAIFEDVTDRMLEESDRARRL